MKHNVLCRARQSAATKRNLTHTGTAVTRRMFRPAHAPHLMAGGVDVLWLLVVEVVVAWNKTCHRPWQLHHLLQLGPQV